MTPIELGLPIWTDGSRVTSLRFNYPSRTLIATVAQSAHSPTCAVFLKAETDGRYREVVPPAPSKHFGFVPVVSEGVANAFLLGFDASLEVATIFRIDLPDGQVYEIVAPSPGNARAVWISQLLAAASDGTWLDVVVGAIPVPNPDGSYRATYSVARLEVATGLMQNLVILSTSFA